MFHRFVSVRTALNQGSWVALDYWFCYKYGTYKTSLQSRHLMTQKEGFNFEIFNFNYLDAFI